MISSSKIKLLAILLLVSCGSAQAEVLVKVGDLEITREEFKQELAAIPADARIRILSNPRQVAALVDGLISRQLFAMEAVRHGIDTDPVIQRRMQIATEGLLVEALRQSVANNIELPDVRALAKERYERNPGQYVNPARVHARHILLHAESGDSLEALHEQIQEIKQRVEQGEDFADLAREFSTDAGSVESGGDLGFFTPGRMVAPFEVVAFDLKEPGDMGIAETRYGVHLIQLIEREEERTRTFEEVEVMLSSHIRNEYRNSYIAEWERELVSKHEATLNQAQIDELVRATLDETRASQ